MPVQCPCDPCACQPCACGCGPNCACGEACACDKPAQTEASA